MEYGYKDYSYWTKQEIKTSFIARRKSWQRRTKFNETDDQVAIKASNSLKYNIHPIVCVGETLAQKKNNQTKEVIAKQINKSIPKNSNNKNTIIAYEPVWAIGTGVIATESMVAESHSKIRSILSDNGLNSNIISIVYGGSVTDKNASALAQIDNVDGFLIGGATLDVEKFYSIYNQL